MNYRTALLLSSAVVALVLGVVVCSPPETQKTESEDVQQQDTTGTDTDDPEPIDDPPDCETWADEPAGLLLTWQQDPTSTMTIDWHTEGDDPRESICFRQADQQQFAEKVEAQPVDVPQFEDRIVYRVELTDLQADTEYVFQTGEFDEEYRFRTMPEDIDDDPLTFAVGGDVMHVKEMFEATNEAVMEHDPAFIAWGGDLAYADGGRDPFHVQRWKWFFEVVRDTLVDEDGRAVPIVVSIGNHEVMHGYHYNHDDFEPTDEWRLENAPYFYRLFSFPDHPGYDVLDFADYMSLVALDSDHTNPVEGEQTDWLESVLQDREKRGVRHIFPLYHIAAFPSVRDPDGDSQTKIRDHWVPLFEQHGVEVVFEKHDHTYKRTRPIRDGEVDDDDGIVYIGDGAWGVAIRQGHSKDEWYIEEFAGERHGIIVTLEGDDISTRTISEHGEQIDAFDL